VINFENFYSNFSGGGKCAVSKWTKNCRSKTSRTKMCQKIGFRAGLPDGLFSNQKSKFGYILEGHGMDNVFAFYYHLKYFMAIWYNLLQFGIVCGIFSQFWYVWTKKNLATLFQSC
jgi:hypothetical protein